MSFFRFYVIGLFLVFLYSNFGGCSCSDKPSKTQKDIDSELNK